MVLVGELDMGVRHEVANRLSLLAHSPSPVPLDLSRLEFIDSAGVQALVLGLKGTRERGCRVRVARRLSLAVERVIELTRIARYLWPDDGAYVAAGGRRERD